MRTTRATAIAMAAFMLVVPLSMTASAHEEEVVPLVITAPADGVTPIPCAVFFADNMVYAPQWRLDNYVRIEAMVLRMDSYSDPTDLLTTDTDLYPGTYVDGLAQQEAVLAESSTVLPQTRMVSVSYIQLTITSPELAEPIVFEAGWNAVTGERILDDGFLTREVNKAGHLIYGMLWNTYEMEAGEYTVSAKLGKMVDGAPVLGAWYDVSYAIAHLYNPDIEGVYLTPGHPYDDLAVDGDQAYEDYGIGEGGLAADAAWVLLGPLIPQGTGGGNGDESDGNHGEATGGNGDHELGQNGVGKGRAR